MKNRISWFALTALAISSMPASAQPAPAQPRKAALPQAVAGAKGVPDKDPPGAQGSLPTTMETIARAVDVPYRPKPAGHLVKFNLQDADLAELVNHISGLTGKRFIYGAKVRQIKATVVSPERSTRWPRGKARVMTPPIIARTPGTMAPTSASNTLSTTGIT